MDRVVRTCPGEVAGLGKCKVDPKSQIMHKCVMVSLQILELARQKSKRVKVIGGGHSPSDIACTDDFMIQMEKMNKVLKVKVILDGRHAMTQSDRAKGAQRYPQHRYSRMESIHYYSCTQKCLRVQYMCLTRLFNQR